MSGSIGDQLKEAREGRGLSVPDVSHVTRITEAQILGLEAGDYSAFPSLAYARSFLGIYSSFLGVDARGEIEAMARPGLTEFRGARLAPKVVTEPQETIIPIVKGLPEVRPRQVKSVLVPLMFLTMLLLLPTAFLLGRRQGQAEARARVEAPAPPGVEPPPEPPGAGVAGGDPISRRKASDGSLPSAPLRPPLPSPALDSLIGAPAPPVP